MPENGRDGSPKCTLTVCSQMASLGPPMGQTRAGDQGAPTTPSSSVPQVGVGERARGGERNIPGRGWALSGTRGGRNRVIFSRPRELSSRDAKTSTVSVLSEVSMRRIGEARRSWFEGSSIVCTKMFAFLRPGPWSPLPPPQHPTTLRWTVINLRQRSPETAPCCHSQNPSHPA